MTETESRNKMEMMSNGFQKGEMKNDIFDKFSAQET